MCTVSYLPLLDGNYILTSNRDETPFRKTIPLQKSDKHPHLFFPRDTMAGGSWICISDKDRVICLLNGAFKKHKRTLPYRKSRGLVVIDCFQLDDIQQFNDEYDLNKIEPFTLVWCDANNLHEFRWDGTNKYLKKLDNTTPHIWASASLYTEEYIEKRKVWFKTWLKHHQFYNAKDILDFHITGGEGNVF